MWRLWGIRLAVSVQDGLEVWNVAIMGDPVGCVSTGWTGGVECGDYGGSGWLCQYRMDWGCGMWRLWETRLAVSVQDGLGVWNVAIMGDPVGRVSTGWTR